MSAYELADTKSIKLSAVDNNLYDRNMDGLPPLSVSENDELRSYFIWNLI